MATDALTTGLGFGFLMMSQVPANRRLGGLAMLAVGTCLLATFVLVPALLSLIRPSQPRRPDEPWTSVGAD